MGDGRGGSGRVWTGRNVPRKEAGLAGRVRQAGEVRWAEVGGAPALRVCVTRCHIWLSSKHTWPSQRSLCMAGFGSSCATSREACGGQCQVSRCQAWQGAHRKPGGAASPRPWKLKGTSTVASVAGLQPCGSGRSSASTGDSERAGDGCRPHSRLGSVPGADHRGGVEAVPSMLPMVGH